MKNNKKAPARKNNKLGIAIICLLCAVIAATVVLMVLDGMGILYKAPSGVQIIPPERVDTKTAKDGDYTYAILKDGTVMITNCALPKDTTEINIPSTLGGYSVSAIGESAFALITDMQVINVPEGVTYIGKAAFFGALNAKLYLPSTIQQIDAMALEGFDDPAGIYFAGNETQWDDVLIGDGNAVLGRVVCTGK